MFVNDGKNMCFRLYQTESTWKHASLCALGHAASQPPTRAGEPGGRQRTTLGDWVTPAACTAATWTLTAWRLLPSPAPTTLHQALAWPHAVEPRLHNNVDTHYKLRPSPQPP
ncbi:hypothetical protein Pcinc_016840 [Petrolisthes cinctipes]|uniref:Uncharacterized protein n=1 Tax=Petrolisthes cinctipes TaxID=88211 RepID=A0AAE1KLE3_PETCI|nr:hypothetical protein Pcinc_016840 [Petrolisthes cinctipes]